MTKKIHEMIDATLARLVTLEDEQGKAHTPEWERLEGYYYGLLDALKDIEGDCDTCGGTYDVGDSASRCGDCGNCGDCCHHSSVQNASCAYCGEGNPCQDSWQHP